MVGFCEKFDPNKLVDAWADELDGGIENKESVTSSFEFAGPDDENTDFDVFESSLFDCCDLNPPKLPNKFVSFDTMSFELPPKRLFCDVLVVDDDNLFAALKALSDGAFGVVAADFGDDRCLGACGGNVGILNIFSSFCD